jgi:hypothetical protein
MAIYDPRLDLARAANQQTRSSSVQRLGDVLKQQSISPDPFANISATTKAPEPSGWKGLVYDVLQSPVGKVVTKGGEILTKPARVIPAIIEEYRKHEEDPNYQSSFSEMWKNINDPTFGFGKVIGDVWSPDSEWGKWGNRLLGAAGDILSDPLTYITLGGSHALSMVDDAGRVIEGAKGLSVASAEGRFALANRLAEIGADANVVKAAAIRGRSAAEIAPDLLSKVGADRAGLYFMGKRIAGTTRIGEGLERSFTSMRIWSGEHMFKRAAQLFTRSDAALAIRAIKTGEVPTDQVVDFLNIVMSRNTERATQGASARLGVQLQKEILGQVAEEDVNTARGIAYKLLEDNAVQVYPTATAEGRLAGAANDYFKRVGDILEAKAADVGAPFPRIENYMPHMPKDEAWTWMAKDTNLASVSARGEVFNPLDPASIFKARMVEGDMWFGERLTAEDIAGGIDALNQLARDRGGLTFDFFETDLPTVMEKYNNMFSAQMGKLERQKYLIDKGTFARLEEKIGVVPEFLEAAKQRAKTAVTARDTALKDASKKVDDLISSIKNFVGHGIDLNKNELEGASLALRRADGVAQAANFNLRNARIALKDLSAGLAEHQNAFAKLIDGRNFIVDAVETRFTDLKNQIDDLSYTLDRANTFDANILSKIENLKTQINDIKKSEAKIAERANLLENHWFDLAEGVEFDGHVRFSRKVERVLNTDAKIPGGATARISGSNEAIVNVDKEVLKQAQSRAKRYVQVADRTKLTPLERERISYFTKLEYERLHGIKHPNVAIEYTEAQEGVSSMKWWTEVNSGKKKIAADKVISAAKPENMQETIDRALRGEATIEEMRATGLALLASTYRSGGSPTHITQDAWESLHRALLRADTAANFYTDVAKFARTNSGHIYLQQVVDNYGKVERTVVNGVEQYVAAKRILLNVFSHDVELDSPVTTEFLQAIVDNPETEALGRYFERYINEEVDFAQLAGMEGVYGTKPEEMANLFVKGTSTPLSEYGRNIARGYAEVAPPEPLTYRSLKAQLEEVVNTVPKLKPEIEYTVVNPNLQNQTVAKTRKVWLEDYIDTLTQVYGDTPTVAEVSDFLDKAIQGRVNKSMRTGYVRGQDARAFDFDIFNPDSSLRAYHQKVRKQLADSEIKIHDRFGQKEVAALKRAMQSGDISYEDFLKGKKSATEKFFKEAGFDNADVLKSAQQELSKQITNIYFAREINERFAAISESFVKEGLMPGPDLFRGVVNSVAKKHVGEIAKEQYAMTTAAYKLRNLINIVDAGEYTTGKELFAMLNKELGLKNFWGNTDNTNAWRNVIDRVNGREDASRLAEQFRILGNLKQTSGYANETKRLKQLLKSKALTDTERAALEAQLKAIPSGEELRILRRRFLDEELRPWYVATIDPAAKKATYEDIAPVLTTMSKYKKGVGRFAEDATPSQMKNWLTDTLTKVEQARKTLSKDSSWIEQAASPYLDIRTSNNLISQVLGQDLPSMYLDSIKMSVHRFEQNASDLFEAQKLATATRSDLREMLSAEEHALAYQDYLTNPNNLPMTKDEFVLTFESKRKAVREARDANRRLVVAQQDPRYFSALERQDVNGLIEALAPYAIHTDTIMNTSVPAYKRAQELFTRDNKVIYYTSKEHNPELLSEIRDTEIEIARLYREQGKLTDPTMRNRMASESVIDAGIASTQTAYEKVSADIQRATQKLDSLRQQTTVVEKVVRVKDISDFKEGRTYFTVGNNVSGKTIDSQQREISKLLKSGLPNDVATAERMQRQLRGGLDVITNGKLMPIVIDKKTLSFTPSELEALFAGSLPRDLIESEAQSASGKLGYAQRKYNEAQRAFDEFVRSNAPSSSTYDFATNKPITFPRGAMVRGGRESVLTETILMPTPLSRDIRATAERLARSNGDSAAEIKRAGQAAVDRATKLYNETKSAYEKAIQEAAAVIDPLKAPRDIAVARVRGAVDKSQQKIALQKLSEVSRAIKRGDFTMEQFIDGVKRTFSDNFVSGHIVDSRKRFLSETWKSSKEFDYLQQVKALSSNADMRLYRAEISDINQVLNTTSKLRDEYTKAMGEWGVTETAPFGSKFNVGEYSKTVARLEQDKHLEVNALVQAGTDPVEAEKIVSENIKQRARESANIPIKGDQAAGLKGAQYRYQKTLKGMMNDLGAITEATRNEYDAIGRYGQLVYVDGISPRNAIETIIKEVETLRPSDQVLSISRTAKDSLAKVQGLEDQIGFLKNVLNNESDIFIQFYGQPISMRTLMAAHRDSLIEPANQLEKELAARQTMADKWYKTQATKLEKPIKKAEDAVAKAEKNVLEAATKYDSARVNLMSARSHWRNVQMPLKEKINYYEKLLQRFENLPNKTADMEVRVAELQSLINETASDLEALGVQTNVTTLKFNSPFAPATVDVATTSPIKGYEKFLRLKTDYDQSLLGLVAHEDNAREALKQLEELKSGKWGQEISYEVSRGFKSLKDMGLPDYQASKEIYNIIDNMQRFNQPAFVKAVNNFIRPYTGFFKAYAVSTPGFVVRNTMSNTFMLLAAGAEPIHMLEGLGLYRQWTKAIANNAEEMWLDSLDDQERYFVNIAIRSSDASGYGKATAEMAGWKPKHARLSDNKWVNTWRNLNEKSENSARFMLAYDSARKGADFNTATARVKKYLFDYVDVGQADDALRGVVPFWFWMSRNLPLQIVNRWTNPRAYNIYYHIMQNIGVPTTEEDIVPSWIKESGGVKLGENVYLTPDFGFNRVQQQLAEFGDPKRFLKYVNPGLRIPVELMGKSRLYNDVPFSSKGQEPNAGFLSPVVQQLANLLGQDKRMPNSSQMGVSDKFNYALSNLNPIQGQLESLYPSSTRGQENVVNSRLSKFGVPITFVTPSMREAEHRRQIMEQNALRDKSLNWGE